MARPAFPAAAFHASCLGLLLLASVFNLLFAGGAQPVGSGDSNSDGGVTAGDVFFLINHLFAGGPAPAP